MLLFVVQDLFMKSLLGELTVWTLILVRSLVAVVVLVPLIVVLGRPHRLLTPLWPLHLVRGALFAFGFTLYYTAFPFMGLVEITTIFYAAPMFTALFAALFLGEKIGVHRAVALLVGFVGVGIAMRPGSGTFQWVALCPLVCAVTYAISQVLTRRIGDRETTISLGLNTLAFAGLCIVPMAYGVNALFDLGDTFPHLRVSWPVPNLQQSATLVLLGCVGMVAIMLLWRAYQVAPASVIAPFDYSYLPWAALFGYLIWSEVPGPFTILGMALIVGAGLYVGFREMSQARRAVVPAPTAESIVAPAYPVAIPPRQDSDFQPARIAPVF